MFWSNIQKTKLYALKQFIIKKPTKYFLNKKIFYSRKRKNLNLKLIFSLINFKRHITKKKNTLHLNSTWNSFWTKTSFTKKENSLRFFTNNHLKKKVSSVFLKNKIFLEQSNTHIESFYWKNKYIHILAKLNQETTNLTYNKDKFSKLLNFRDFSNYISTNTIKNVKKINSHENLFKTIFSQKHKNYTLFLTQSLSKHNTQISFSKNTSLLDNFVSDNIFVKPQKNYDFMKPTIVLSKVPIYKMDDNSAVTADRYRGNTYSNLGFTRITSKKILKILNFRGKLTFNSFPYSKFKASKLKYVLNPDLGWLSYISKKVQNFQLRLQYLKTKNYTINSLVNRILLNTKKNKINLLLVMKFKKKKFFSSRKKLLKKNKTISFFKIPILGKTQLRKKQNYSKAKTKKNINFIMKFLSWKAHKTKNNFISIKKLIRKRRNYLFSLTQTNYYPSRNIDNTALKKLNLLEIKNSKKTKLFFNDLNFLNTRNSVVLFSKPQNIFKVLNNSIFLKQIFLTNKSVRHNQSLHLRLISKLINLKTLQTLKLNTNLTPHSSFNKNLSKKVLNSFTNKNFDEDITPWYYHTLIRFIEHCSGTKVVFQFYPFVNQLVSFDNLMRYKRWLPRMVFYERKLGHRFFLEEALHIMHLSFVLRDPKLITSWLKAMILRINFFKTRSIFRFIKYLFHNYFKYVFEDLHIKGLKIKLKGKISAAGNSRKRTILYRIGKTSHSETNIRVLQELTTVNTFTGVMGLSVLLFY